MRWTIFSFLILIGMRLSAQDIQMITLDELNGIIEAPANKLKVINFWASWCKPCIMEMPHFEAISTEQATVYFVSVDHPDDLEKVKRMANKHSVKSKLLLLNEKDTDKYIASINSDWSGAIPATLFVDVRGNKYFHEEALDKHQLENIVNKYGSHNE